MKAKDKFKKMFVSLPEEAKTELVLNPFYNPHTLAICHEEISKETRLGKMILEKLGYKDD